MVVITLTHEQGGPDPGANTDRRKRRGGRVTLFNKVTEEERNEQRQSERRYKQDRRSDSLKR